MCIFFILISPLLREGRSCLALRVPCENNVVLLMLLFFLKLSILWTHAGSAKYCLLIFNKKCDWIWIYKYTKLHHDILKQEMMTVMMTLIIIVTVVIILGIRKIPKRSSQCLPEKETPSENKKIFELTRKATKSSDVIILPTTLPS